MYTLRLVLYLLKPHIRESEVLYLILYLLVNEMLVPQFLLSCLESNVLVNKSTSGKTEIRPFICKSEIIDTLAVTIAGAL